MHFLIESLVIVTSSLQVHILVPRDENAVGGLEQLVNSLLSSCSHVGRSLFILQSQQG